MRNYKHPEKIVAGIGNRDTPPYFVQLLTLVMKRLADEGWWWSTGASGNADNAIMNASVRGYYYPPWDKFEGFKMHHQIPKKAFELAKKYNEHYDSMSQGVKKLHARNMMVISGPYVDPEHLVNLVLCYTRDGCYSTHTRTRSTGGTGSAIAFAFDVGIPIINLRNKDALELLSIHTGIDFMDIVVPPEMYRLP